MSDSVKPLPDQLCLIPFMSLNVHPTGTYRLCPTARTDISSINQDDLHKVWNGGKMQAVRGKMLENEKVTPTCNTCHSLESEGIASKRTRYNKRNLNIYGSTLCHQAVQKPRTVELDLSFSNLCNLHCVMCDSDYSSSWFHPDEQAQSRGLEFRNFRNVKPWSLSNKIIDQIIESHADSLRHIAIKGGEPLIDKQCLYFLKRLSAFGNKNKNLTVYIQTNGTTINDKIMEALSGLTSEISFSIDGLGRHYEWIRGYSFHKIIANLDKLKSLSGLRYVYLHYTASAYNFHRIADFIQFAFNTGKTMSHLRKTTFGVAHQEYNSFRVFSKKERLNCVNDIEKLVKKLKINNNFFDGYGPLISELKNDKLNIKAVDKFKKWLAFCNDLRGTSLQTVDEKFKTLYEREFA